MLLFCESASIRISTECSFIGTTLPFVDAALYLTDNSNQRMETTAWVDSDPAGALGPWVLVGRAVDSQATSEVDGVVLTAALLHGWLLTK
jgi:hypothetical protein